MSARCGGVADLQGFSVRATVQTPASDREFQTLARALHAIADRADAEEVLQQALEAAGWEHSYD